MKTIRLGINTTALIEAAKQTLVAIVGWIIIWPLSLVTKRNSHLTVVITRPGRLFSDNTKYFFAYASALAQKDEKVVYLTANRQLHRQIQQAGAASLIHPSWSSVLALLRCGKVVTDSVLFENKPLTRGAQLIQLWHGAPLKHIELDLYRRRLEHTSDWLRPLLQIQKAIIERHPTYDLVVSTSRYFIDKAFKSCFLSERFIAPGYPRNDILFGWPEEMAITNKLARINIDQDAMRQALTAQEKGQKICLYVPTFRKDLNDPFETEIDLALFSDFARQNDLVIIVKLHPFMHGRYRFGQYDNIIEYEPLSDVYPLMALSDLLITDYSSIFFDYLLLNRPVVFFAYDLKHYLEQDRLMYFDYDEMTPGAKCFQYNQLEDQLVKILANGCNDGYEAQRKEVLRKTHDHVDNMASYRLIKDYLSP